MKKKILKNFKKKEEKKNIKKSGETKLNKETCDIINLMITKLIVIKIFFSSNCLYYLLHYIHIYTLH